MEIVIRTRRQFLQSAALWPACLALRAGDKEFWKSKDPAVWTGDEKQMLLEQSPWARVGVARMDLDKQLRRPPSREPSTRPGGDTPYMTPGLPPGGVPSVPIGGDPPPRVPKPDSDPVQFRVLARWETAKPVRLADGPPLPDLSGKFYVIRLRGLPLMPPPKPKPGEEPARDPNADLLQAMKEGSRLDRRNRPAIRCAHLFTGSGDAATDVLLFFPRETDPIVPADRSVTLECVFAPFQLSVKFSLKDMMYKGELAL